MFLFKKKQSLLGVKISGNTVSLLELDTKKQIKAYAVSSNSKLEIALQQALAQMNTNVKNAAIAMPHCAVIFKTIELDPSLSDYEIESYIFANCQKLIGLPLEKIKLDYRIAEKNKRQKTKVELFATRAEWVEEKITLLKAANLEVVAADIDSYALLRAVKQRESLFGVTAVVYAAQTNFIFFVTNKNQIIFYKEAAKIGECLELYKTTENDPIQRLLLIGDLAGEELKISVQEVVDFPCSLLDSNEKWSWLAYGLALRGFNND
jgi:Tfp pilus assembly PilM family ATPase